MQLNSATRNISRFITSFFQIPFFQEIFNPFPTIAVWAAVKFVHKREVVPSSGTVHHQFAFLPLISDPDSQVRRIN